MGLQWSQYWQLGCFELELLLLHLSLGASSLLQFVLMTHLPAHGAVCLLQFLVLGAEALLQYLVVGADRLLHLLGLEQFVDFAAREFLD